MSSKNSASRKLAQRQRSMRKAALAAAASQRKAQLAAKQGAVRLPTPQHVFRGVVRRGLARFFVPAGIGFILDAAEKYQQKLARGLPRGFPQGLPEYKPADGWYVDSGCGIPRIINFYAPPACTSAPRSTSQTDWVAGMGEWYNPQQLGAGANRRIKFRVRFAQEDLGQTSPTTHGYIAGPQFAKEVPYPSGSPYPSRPALVYQAGKPFTYLGEQVDYPYGVLRTLDPMSYKPLDEVPRSEPVPRHIRAAKKRMPRGGWSKNRIDQSWSNGTGVAPDAPHQPQPVRPDNSIPAVNQQIWPRNKTQRLRKGSHALARQKRGVKEIKMKPTGAHKGLLSVVSTATEALDIIDVAYEMIPFHLRPRYRYRDSNGKWRVGRVMRRPTPFQKLGAIYDNIEYVNRPEFLEKLVISQLKDVVYGQIGQLGAISSQQLGRHYGFGWNTFERQRRETDPNLSDGESDFPF